MNDIRASYSFATECSETSYAPHLLAFGQESFDQIDEVRFHYNSSSFELSNSSPMKYDHQIFGTKGNNQKKLSYEHRNENLWSKVIRPKSKVNGVSPRKPDLYLNKCQTTSTEEKIDSSDDEFHIMDTSNQNNDHTRDLSTLSTAPLVLLEDDVAVFLDDLSKNNTKAAALLEKERLSMKEESKRNLERSESLRVLRLEEQQRQSKLNNYSSSSSSTTKISCTDHFIQLDEHELYNIGKVNSTKKSSKKPTFEKFFKALNMQQNKLKDRKATRSEGTESMSQKKNGEKVISRSHHRRYNSFAKQNIVVPTTATDEVTYESNKNSKNLIGNNHFKNDKLYRPRFDEKDAIDNKMLEKERKHSFLKDPVSAVQTEGKDIHLEEATYNLNSKERKTLSDGRLLKRFNSLSVNEKDFLSQVFQGEDLKQ